MCSAGLGLVITTAQAACFVQVGGDHGGSGNQQLPQGAGDSLAGEFGTTAGDQYRVQHQRAVQLAGDAGQQFHLRPVAQQPQLDRIDLQILAQRRDLLADQFGRNSRDRAAVDGVLHGERGHDTQRVRALRLHRFYVGLQPGTAAGVEAGNAQDRAAAGFVRF